MKEISGITTTALKNGAHIEFMNRMKTIVEADPTAKAKAATYLTPLSTALAQETSDFAVVTKSLKTDDLDNADKARDKYYSSMKQIVESSVNSPLEDVAKAANNINLIIKAHALDPQGQIDEETAKLASITDDLLGDYKTDAATVGITAYVTAIKEQNELVRKATAERQAEKEGKAVGAMKADRAVTDDQYRLMIKLLNAYSFIDYATTGSSELEPTIVKLNLEIKHYKEQALGVKASSTSTDNNSSAQSTPSTSGDGDSSSSDSGNSGSSVGDDSGLSNGNDDETLM